MLQSFLCKCKYVDYSINAYGKALLPTKERSKPKIVLNNCSNWVYYPRNPEEARKAFASDPHEHTVILFVWVSAKFGTCTVVSVNGTLEDTHEDKMGRFKGECAHFRFNKCPIYTYDGASAKYSTNSHETKRITVQSDKPMFILLVIQYSNKNATGFLSSLF